MKERKIEIKSYFSGWKEVDLETARGFVENFYNNCPNRTAKETIEHINKNKLRGITFEELFND